MHAVRSSNPSIGAVVLVDDIAALTRVREPDTQAAVFAPAHRPAWEAELACAVERGDFTIERCLLNVDCSEALVHILEQRLPQQGLSFATRLALIDDLASLAEWLTEIAGCRGVMVRLLTEAPSDHCGFHVDTVAPGVPAFGVLKVYNGRGTTYVDAGDVADMSRFYEYLGQHERLVREWQRALAAHRAEEAEKRHTAMRALDAALPFLHESAAVHEIPAGAVIAFRNLDIREHWSAHPSERAWIHCSPMAGVVRLVANFTPLDAARRG